MASKIERPARRPRAPDMSGEQQRPSSSPRRPPVTNVMLVGQQLAQAFGAAQALIDRIPRDPDAAIEELRRWYYRQHPAERDRLLWQRFTTAEHLSRRLESAIRVAREALEMERLALVESQAERERLAARPLPATVAEEAYGTRDDVVHRYQALGIEWQERSADDCARADRRAAGVRYDRSECRPALPRDRCGGLPDRRPDTVHAGKLWELGRGASRQSCAVSPTASPNPKITQAAKR